MSQKIVNCLVLMINKGISWESWDERSRRALAGSLSPMIGASSCQKGASDEQWESSKVMRHLFGKGTLPLPAFIIKQWLAVPDIDKEYWRSIGHLARPEILKKTVRKTIGESSNHA